jgi:tetrapyrrole methylase family protein / MazG family protein
MDEFARLVELMATLRSERGCPWDRKQTVGAFKTFLLEEVYELIDAIELEDYRGIKEELGDLLFHIIFISQICKEQGEFDIRQVVADTHDKMYKRHPHVFSGTSDATPVERRWEELKKEEKEDYSRLGNIPKMIPALLRAYIVSRRLARAGIDLDRIQDAHHRLSCEFAALQKVENSDDQAAVRQGIGAVLFSVVDVARLHGIDPEDALRRIIDRFVMMFSYLENETNLQGVTTDTLDRLWNEVKDVGKRGSNPP